MPRTREAKIQAPYAFTYTPGDHHRYTWSGGGWIGVDKITTRGTVITFTPTGELIPVPEGSARTATVLMAVVDLAHPRSALPDRKGAR